MSQSQYACPETLADTQWLSKHLNDSNVRILEIDLDSKSYERGHIPGSIFLNAMTPLKSNFQFNFDPKNIEKLLGNLGITNNTTIVIVHNSYIGTSGCNFWLLKIFGHDKIKILNGGIQKWLIDGYPITKEKTVITPVEYHAQSPNENSKIPLTELKKLLENNQCTLLDVRTPQEYCGEIFMTNPPTENERGGHIPSAINLYYELAHNDDDTFKSLAELQDILAQHNITPDKLIIPYCAVGARSAHMWFILKYLLGYPNVRNYDGSWNEWSRMDELPIEK